MNLLSQIESGARLRPRRVLLYGTAGIGLSAFVAQFPNAVFVPADDSLAHLDCRRFPVPQRFGHVLKALQELLNEPHGYRVIVIDPLDALERLIFDDVRRDFGIEHVETLSFATGAKLALEHWRELLSALDALRDDLGMTCLLIGHARSQRIADPSSSTPAPLIVERNVPALEARASSLIESWCDAVLFAMHAGSGSDSASMPSSTADKKQAANRFLCTTPAPTHVAKNRLGLPPRIAMDTRELARRLAIPKHPLCA